MQDTDTENEEIAFIIDAGKNEENTPIFRNHTKESTERLLQSIGFPVHSISVSGTSNVEFAAMIEKSGGESYVAANVGDRIDHWITHLNLNVDGYDMLDTDGDGIYDTVEVNGVRPKSMLKILWQMHKKRYTISIK